MLDFPRWKITSILVLLAALMALAIPSFVPEKYTQSWMPRISLGLDLAGGIHLLYEADTDAFVETRLDNMSQQISGALKRSPRIDIGDISSKGGQLSFLVRDVTKIDEVRERLLTVAGSGAGLTGQRVWDISVVDASRFVVTPTKAGVTQAVNQAMDDTTENIRRRIDALGTKEPVVVRQGSNRILVQVPGLQNPDQLKQLVGKTAKLEFKMVDDSLGNTQVTKDTPAPIGSQVLPYPEGGGYIVVKRPVILTGGQLTEASQGFAQQTNAPIVNFTFNSEGGRKFARITQQFTGQRFAVIIDNVVISAPRINTPILGGSGYIEGNFTAASANELAIALKSGQLAMDLKVVEERTVGPDLGKESIHAGILASAIAAAAVVIFMFITYGRFGAYANLAVVINVFVILGVMAVFGSTLTLPGIAGFVLTIGTAVDANVLINERIREERRRGRSVIQSVELGYKEASRTIFEANMTHAISGVIMLALGSGPVKGFAVVLLIGICTSVFTAVTFTRMLVVLWVRRTRPSDINI